MWATNAPVLARGLVRTTCEYNGKPNVAAEHALGAASALLTIEAYAERDAKPRERKSRPEFLL